MWTEVHDTLPDHEKVVMVSEALDIPDTQVIGMLVCAWLWGINQRRFGKLSAADWKAIERAARWTGEPRALFSALLTAHWIDKTADGFEFHDWMDYAGRLELKRSDDAERKRKERATKPAGIPADVHRTSIGHPQDIKRTSAGNRKDSARTSAGCPAVTYTEPIPLDEDDDTARVRTRVSEDGTDIQQEREPMESDVRRLEDSWKQSFGKECNPAQSTCLRNLAWYNPIELMESAIHEAAARGADINPIQYLSEILATWRSAKLTNLAELGEWKANKALKKDRPSPLVLNGKPVSLFPPNKTEAKSMEA